MKHIITLLIAVLAFGGLRAQEKSKSLPAFNKIVVSPRINLILIKGDKESVRLLCNNIAPEKVNIKVHGKKLCLFLDHARIVEKQVHYNNGSHHGSHGIYDNVSITAYVTYRDLKALEMRGESELSADEPIVADKLKLRIFGECEVNLAAVEAQKFKASLYGESKMTIKHGEVNRQVYRIFGETRIDTQGVLCATAAVRMYGEGRMILSATDEIHVTAIGENDVKLFGDAIINRGLTIGENSVRRN